MRETPETQAPEFDLDTVEGWRALVAEWRNRRAAHDAAVDAFGKYEDAALAEIAAAGRELSKYEKEAIRDRLGQEELEARVSAASDAADELLELVLTTPAPTVEAFHLKLDVIGHREGIFDLSQSGECDYWETFIADVRRFVGNVPDGFAACPVAAIADEMAQALDAEQAADRIFLHADEQSAEYERAKKAGRLASDMHDELARAATLERAISAKGALLQAGLAHYLLGQIMDALKVRLDREEEVSGEQRQNPETVLLARAAFYERRDVLDNHRQLDRCLHSVARFLRTLPGGGDRKCADAFMPPYLDPFGALDLDAHVMPPPEQRSAPPSLRVA